MIFSGLTSSSADQRSFTKLALEKSSIKFIDSDLQKIEGDFEINGDLILKSCKKLKTFIGKINISGDLILENCSSLRNIAGEISVGGNLILTNFKGSKIKADLRIGHNLILTARELVILDSNIVVEGDATISMCKIFKTLKILGSLNLKYCYDYNIIGKIEVKKDLNLESTIFSDFPNNLIVGRSIDLRCTKITKLPEDFQVQGSLNLRNCTFLEKLPKGLVVDGVLDLRGTKVKYLPLDSKAKIVRFKNLLVYSSKQYRRERKLLFLR